MAATSKSLPVAASYGTAEFPEEELCNRLRPELVRIAEDSALLSGEWEPCLDSLSVVSVLICIEDLFDFKIPPEKVVKKGGYDSVDQGITHIVGQLRKLSISN